MTNENKITNTLIKKGFFSKLFFYFKLRTQKITYDVICMYIDFLYNLEKLFFYDNDVKSKLCVKMDIKDNSRNWLILGTESYQVYICPIDDNYMTIRIIRLMGNKIRSNMTFNFDNIDKVTEYDRYLLDKVFKIIRKEIANLFKKYMNKV